MTVRFLVFLAMLALSACAARPLSQGERALARDLFGANLDVDRVRVTSGFGAVPRKDPPLPGMSEPIRPEPGLCDRTAPDTGPPEPPPAFALYDRVHLMRDFYRADVMPGWPDAVLIPEVLIFSHELVHVWQWQNRGLTGYRPARAALESVVQGDPYFYVPGKGAGFLDYGYEQQAALVEDYMCYLIFDPKAPRRAEIRKLLTPYFTIPRLEQAMGR